MVNKQTLENIVNHVVQTVAKIPPEYGIMGVSYGMGLGLAALGESIGGNWKIGVPTIPLLTDVGGGGRLSLKTYVPYAFGVATNYFGPICEVSKEILRNNWW